MVSQFEKKNNIKFYDSKNKKTGKITRRFSIVGKIKTNKNILYNYTNDL